jgi:MFS transporter, BCD family, chlorophyll transporter
VTDVPALELNDVTVVRGDVEVLRGVTLRVRAGGAIGIAGGNGSGKTTLLDAISGIVAPASGSITIDGTRAIARTFQESHLYPQLTVAEALRVASGTRPASETLAAIGLEGRATSYVSELSTGQRRRLEFAAATARGARLLLLDEPTAGIAPADRDALIADIQAWRARTGGTLVIVEHDTQALTTLADTVVVLDAGRIEGELPNTRYGHIATSRDEAATRNVANRATIASLLDRLEPLARAEPTTTRGPSVWSLARFGLREFAAGMLSVLTLGVLNRVMKVELGIPLALVAVVLAAYNLSAPLAIWIGARSDRSARRAPYILGGALLTAIAAFAAPFVAWQLDPPTVATAALAIGLFAAMGAGMYGSGAVYFALLAECVAEHRERAIAVVYSMLMAGILAGVGLSAYVMPDYTPRALVSLHGIVAIAIVALTWWAVRGAERSAKRPATTAPMQFRTLLTTPGSKGFFVFMVAITFFAFLQQALLEPFGGDVFGMSVGRTTAFNAVQISALLVGMALAVRSISPRVGKKRTTAIGVIIAAGGAAFLAISGTRGSEVLLYAGILALGFGMGVLNVGSLSLMLDMTTGVAAGLSMGLWTVAHALADGAATAGGGVLHTVAVGVLGSDAPAYSAVFAIQCVGLVAVIGLLPGIDPDRFRLAAEERGGATPS